MRRHDHRLATGPLYTCTDSASESHTDFSSTTQRCAKSFRWRISSRDEHDFGTASARLSSKEYGVSKATVGSGAGRSYKSLHGPECVDPRSAEVRWHLSRYKHLGHPRSFVTTTLQKAAKRGKTSRRQFTFLQAWLREPSRTLAVVLSS